MIALLADLVVLLVALLHVGIMILEMLLWDKPPAKNLFRMSAERAAATRVIAANLGLYNGFLAAGLFWGLVPDVNASAIKGFFLACVVVAGIYGGLSVHRKIMFVQSAPAAFGLLLVLIS